MTGVSELERGLRFIYQQLQDLQNSAGVALNMTPQMPTALYVGPQWIISGGGSVIPVGMKGRLIWTKGSATIVGWTIVGSPAGTIAFDIKKGNYSIFPTVASICGGNFPSISSSGQKATSPIPLFGWTTSITDGDIFECYVTGTPAVMTDVTITLNVVR